MNRIRSPFCTVFLVIVSVCTAGCAGRTTVDRSGIRQLFENRRFGDLTSIFHDFQKAGERDVKWEFATNDALDVFNTHRVDYEPLLNEWVAALPNNWVPLVARATYYNGLAWRARGGRVAKDTKREQFQGMSDYMNLVARDAEAAIRLNPRAQQGYYLLMKVALGCGNEERAEVLLREALKIAPGSYLIRRQRMQSLLPRWGGSYAEMERFVAESAAYVAENPALRTLAGTVDWDLANAARARGDYEGAIELYWKSLNFGATLNTLADLSRAYADHGQYDKALETVDNVIVLFPGLPDRYILSGNLPSDVYRLRARILLAKGRWTDALTDLERFKEVGWRADDAAELRRWAGARLAYEGGAAAGTDVDKAIEYFTLGLAFCPDNADIYGWRGAAYARNGRLDVAEADYRKAISLDPRLSSAYDGLGYLLFTRNAFDDAIDLWTRMIELEPSNGKAYLERSRSYFRKKDSSTGFRDIKKACELGNAEACGIFRPPSNLSD